MSVKLFSAMAKAFPDIENATKDKVNPAFRSKYADLGAVVEAIKPALVSNDLWFAQVTHEHPGGVCVETIVCHASGEQFSFGKLALPATKQDAQGYGSALTYARRYSLMSAFGIAAEDDDGNAASRRAPANDAPPPSPPRAKLDGPHTSKSALKAALHGVVREIEGCGDLDQFEAFIAMPETQATIKQCERDAPEWAVTGEGMPAEFVPLLDRITTTRTALTAATNEGWQRDVIRN
jgi:hypothetical protein